MFGFLTSSSRKGTGPLVTPKTAENWLRRLPAIDLLDRQRQLAHALEALSKSQLDIDLNRVAAIQHVDAMSSADRRQLFKQFCGATRRLPLFE